MTTDQLLEADDFPIRAAAILSGGSGVAMVVRAPTSAAGDHPRWVHRVRALARPTEAATVVHADAQLAREASAQGVQLDEPEVAAARSALGPGWVGVAITTPDQADLAAARGADYLVALDWNGIDWLRAIAQRGRPVFAAAPGGPESVAHLAAAGTWGTVAPAALWSGPDPARATALWLEAWSESR
jgi:thiamine monophosphate synthase